MNREEAINMVKGTIERLSFIAGGGLYPEERIELLEAFAALRSPQPDPITGLVPCGCGGKAEYYYHPIEDWVAVECVECGAGTSYKDTKEQARDAWNLSHSYREGTAE